MGLDAKDIENMSDVGSDIMETDMNLIESDIHVMPTIEEMKQESLNSTAQGLQCEEKPSAENLDSSKLNELSRTARKRAQKMMQEEGISVEEAILRIKNYNVE